MSEQKKTPKEAVLEGLKKSPGSTVEELAGQAGIGLSTARKILVELAQQSNATRTPVIVGLGRLGETRAQIDGAAAQAARAASIARTPSEATAMADQSLSAATSAGMRCPEMTSNIDVSRFAPGGLVVVEVSCREQLASVTGVGIPGSKLLQSRAVAVVDTFRGVG